MSPTVAIIISLIIFSMVNFYIWADTSKRSYGEILNSGDTYTLGGRTYTVPDIPLVGRARLLSESVFMAQRKLLQQVTKALTHNDIEHWMAGGTLLGFTRHQTFIPWDDDLDVHTHWKHRDYMFSAAFNADLRPFGLELILLFGNSAKMAGKGGAAARVRQKGTMLPICDIFFVHEDPSTGKFCKVDSWAGKRIVYSQKERWHHDDLFPIVATTVDDLVVPMPHTPLAIVQQQYGVNVMDVMYARNHMISHRYPFQCFVVRWVWYVPNEVDHTKSRKRVDKEPPVGVGGQ